MSRKIKLHPDRETYPGEFDLDDIVECIKSGHYSFTVGDRYTVRYSNLADQSKEDRTSDWLVVNGILINNYNVHTCFKLIKRETSHFKGGDKVIYIQNEFDELRGRTLTVSRISSYENTIRFDEIPNKIYRERDFILAEPVIPPAPKKSDTGGWGFD